MNIAFETFPLSPLVLDAIREANYEKATPVQAETIPKILEGKDLIALAETGSGKTAACAIPLVEKADPTSSKIQSLIIVPTRELALQYSSETQKMGKCKQVKVFAIFGGEDMGLQKEKLKHGVQILIATPGRLIDFIFSKAIDLSQVRSLVLDEADQMLGMGFYEDLEFIINCLVQEHQTLLFSATMPVQIKKLAKEHMRFPEEISLIHTQKSPESLHHQFYFCHSAKAKADELIYLLEKTPFNQCIIFGNSRFEVEALYRRLRNNFERVDFYHGGLEQTIRSIVTQKFSKEKIRILVASDIAARGLDFNHVTHVFNLHLPKDKETYFHRAGRTGRSGKTGTCISLISFRELKQANQIMAQLTNSSWLKEPPKKH